MSTSPQGFSINPWRSNMYAPCWAAISRQLPGFCDTDFDYPAGLAQAQAAGTIEAVSIAAGQILLGRALPALQIAIDSDADYLAREIYISPIGGSGSPANPQDLKMRLQDGDGNFITSDWVTANDLCGPLGPIPLPFRKGSIAYVDLWNQGSSALTVQVGLKGFKRWACSDQQPPVPPFLPVSKRYCKEWSGVRFEEYEYFFEFGNGSSDSAFVSPWSVDLAPISPNGIFAHFPLQTDTDADFLWRGITGMIMSPGGPVSQIPQEAFLGFYDDLTVPLFNQQPRAGATPSAPPPGAELVISNGGGRAVPVFPEILVKRGGVIPLDICLQIPSGLNLIQFSLRGFKVYNEMDCSL